MRIFIGTQEIAAQLGVYASGFRALGHAVTTGVYEGHFYKFDNSLEYDVVIKMDDIKQANSIIEQHDVFLFQFGSSLLRNNYDYRMIKRAGKK